MTGQFTCYKHSAALPSGWDAASQGQPFLQRSFLQLLEETNPRGQRYYYLDGADHASLFVTYRHRLDILTYGPGRWAMDITMVGVPCSVASPGFVMRPDAMAAFANEIAAIKGGVLILNAPEPGLSCLGAAGTTLPSCILKTKGVTFQTYLDGMRSHYRYKIKKSMARFQDIDVTVLPDNAGFDRKLYALYEQVYQRSDYKLEKLPITFFQKSKSTITIFSMNDEPLAFSQAVMKNRVFFFLFGGIDYSRNHGFDTYFNLLIHLVKTGFEAKAHTIDLGQSAEDIKTRLGCEFVPRYLYARHSNALVHFGITRGIGLLSYKKQLVARHVFK